MNIFLDTLGIYWNFISENMIYFDIILIVIIIFFQKRDPIAIFLWILLLVIAPVGGLVLYIFLGQQIHKEQLFKIKGLEDTFNEFIRRDNRSKITTMLKLSTGRLSDFEELLHYNMQVGNIPYTENNQVSLFTDGREKFDDLKAELKMAKRYIYFQYYIIRDDEVFRQIIPILIEKSREGVKICIIYDGMGCRMMKKKVWRRLEREGIETVSFFPPIFGPLNFRMNFRNHRKIVVIDGRVAYIGGFNVGREYVGLDKKFGYWRDTHIKICGEAVMPVELRFILDWNYAIKNIKRQLKLSKPKYFTGFEKKVGVQIITCGPDMSTQLIRDNFIKMIFLAKKSIKIQTPYFIPDESLITALKIAIHSGVEVELMIPNKPDHPFVLSATRYFAGLFIEEGAKCYEYNNGFLHSKLITVDGLVSSIGTTNMDIRSFKLNFEINAVIFDEELARKVEKSFEEDKKRSTLISPEIYKRRGIVKRFKEKVARLFSPLM